MLDNAKKLHLALVKGKAMFEQHCVACHDARSKGDGYPFLKPPPADLTAFTVLAYVRTLQR